ncbi:MAG: Nif11 domain/cupin domain-containing protein [Cyanobacteriota bacterium]|nr:Nif11 domain/cupin domain-containing protein [Cyanobacteriota bacterium]
MSAADLERFLEKIRQLNAFVALSERDASLRQALIDCDHHDAVVALARSRGFEIGRRWGESPSTALPGSSLLAGPIPPHGTERVEVLLRTSHLRLERIHSCGASSPPGFWYDQSEAEWVCLLRGQASLQFADEPSARLLQTGDSLWISPNRRHRLLATDPAPGTIWLAVFWSEDPVG